MDSSVRGFGGSGVPGDSGASGGGTFGADGDYRKELPRGPSLFGKAIRAASHSGSSRMALNQCKRKCASTPVSDGASWISQGFSPDGLRRSAFNSTPFGAKPTETKEDLPFSLTPPSSAKPLQHLNFSNYFPPAPKLDTWFLRVQPLPKKPAPLKHPSFGGMRDFYAVLSKDPKVLPALSLRQGACRGCQYCRESAGRSLGIR